jgi:hypothetical protein
MVLSFPLSVSALNYNIYLKEGKIIFYPTTDAHTKIPTQACDFKIVHMVTEQSHNTEDYALSNFANGEQPSEWGCTKIETTNGLLTSSSIYALNDKIVSESVSNLEYAAHTPTDAASLQMVHNSFSIEESSFFDRYATALHYLPNSTIGELSFNLMPHLVYSSVNSTVPDGSEGVFYVDLLHEVDQTPAVSLFFKTRPFGQSNMKISGYIQTLDPNTGQKNIPVEFFTGYPDNFNWLNVKIFFDSYNDVYNVSIGQYSIDFKEYLVKPQIIIIQGEQHDSNNRLTNKGYRYAEGHLVNKIKFRLENYAFNKPSYAYIDSLRIKQFSFPAVYANVNLKNSTLLSNPSTASGISYMNNSIISCYEPPKFPDGTYQIGYTNQYLLNALNPGLLTPWIMAPVWGYLFPLVVTNNHELNIRSILAILNNVDQPLETRGVNQPIPNSVYSLEPGMGFAEQWFELNTTESRPYYYLFSARYSNYVFVVEYYNGANQEGILKSINYYPGDNVNSIPEYVLKTNYVPSPIPPPDNMFGMDFLGNIEMTSTSWTILGVFGAMIILIAIAANRGWIDVSGVGSSLKNIGANILSPRNGSKGKMESRALWGQLQFSLVILLLPAILNAVVGGGEVTLFELPAEVSVLYYLLAILYVVCAFGAFFKYPNLQLINFLLSLGGMSTFFLMGEEPNGLIILIFGSLSLALTSILGWFGSKFSK